MSDPSVAQVFGPMTVRKAKRFLTQLLYLIGDKIDMSLDYIYIHNWLQHIEGSLYFDIPSGDAIVKLDDLLFNGPFKSFGPIISGPFVISGVYTYSEVSDEVEDNEPLYLATVTCSVTNRLVYLMLVDILSRRSNLMSFIDLSLDMPSIRGRVTIPAVPCGGRYVLYYHYVSYNKESVESLIKETMKNLETICQSLRLFLVKMDEAL